MAAVVSLLVARVFRLPEAYWAPITTLVITQSPVGAAFAVSSQRFAGTMLGAVAGGVTATYSGSHALESGSGPNAYRFGGVAPAIVVSMPRWRWSYHRAER